MSDETGTTLNWDARHINPYKGIEIFSHYGVDDE